MKYILLLSFSFFNLLLSQESHKDTIPTFTVDAIVITADRFKNTLSGSTSSVSVIDAQQLQLAPVRTLSDALNVVPGFAVIDRNGTGRDPIISSRGFFGGGEAEYCLVLIDGQPINDVETGLVNWNLVPLSAVSSIEIVRGASSPLYGDAALGGIVNIITESNGSSRTTGMMSGGSYDTYSLGLHRKGSVLNLPYQFYLSNERTHGYREHSGWQGTTFGGDIMLSSGTSGSVKLTTLSQWTNSDDPGPLSSDADAFDPTNSNEFYKGDGKNERRNQLTLHYSNLISENADFAIQLFYHHKTSQMLRTFTNTAVEMDASTFSVTRVTDTLFGDTKQRDIATNEVGITSSYTELFSSGLLPHRLNIGVDVSRNTAHSMYFNVFGGREDDYKAQPQLHRASNALTDGSASRNTYAMYLFDELKPTEEFIISIGTRLDYLESRYEGELPETTMNISSFALSPKMGINYRYATGDDFSGNLFVSANRSFKAPTLDQLSDQRPIDAGVFTDFGGGMMFMTFPAAPFSNSDLKPQRGMSYEIGMYNKMKFSEQYFGEVSLSLFQLDMKDEIDFDLMTYRYQNILESRHRGIEAGLKLYVLPGITSSFNYSHNDVIFVGGLLDGNNLKGIPRNVWNIGFGYHSDAGFNGSMTFSSLSETYLDDMNTTTLPDFSTVDAKLSYTVSQFSLSLESHNLFDKKYSSTGYLLNGKKYLYPAAGRAIRAGVEVQF